MSETTASTGALFSPCRRYRYRLWRVWDPTLPRAVFCMLNPSHADETNNDQTIERQERRVRMWAKTNFMHVGGIEVVNLFAYIETYSHRLIDLHRRGVDLVGPDNDEAILAAARESAIFVCGWGNEGLLGERWYAVVQRLKKAGVVPHALKINGTGMPAHPLYLAYGLKPQPLEF